jgi:predicted DNA binding CopG/RHH family protein
MPAKKVSMSTKSGRLAKPANVDKWVEGDRKEEKPPAPEEKVKRLTLDISESLHKAIKSRSVEEGGSMVDMLRKLLEKEYGSK